jgi:hypothetical protein
MGQHLIDRTGSQLAGRVGYLRRLNGYCMDRCGDGDGYVGGRGRSMKAEEGMLVGDLYKEYFKMRVH